MRQLVQTALLAFGLAVGAPVSAATVVTLVPVTGHPNLPVTISGSGFGAGEAVDVYVDTVDTLLAVSSATGTIKATVTMPASAQPGSHYITAIGRKSGDAAQKAFNVSTNWIESGFGAAHLAWNQYENTLGPGVVPSLEFLWAQSLGLSTGNVIGSPAVVGGKIYVGSGSGDGLYSFSAATGALIWKQPTIGQEGIWGSPAVAGTVVYVVGRTGILYAVNAANGTLIWSQQLGSSDVSGPVVVAGIIYVGCGNSVYALDTTGTILWTGATAGSVQSTPAVAAGRVFVTSGDSKLYAFDATTGATLWTYPSGAAIMGSPSVADGVVHFGAQDGKIYAVRAATGVTVWITPTGNGTNIAGSPAVAGGMVYIPMGAGLYALTAMKGAILWTATLGAGSEGQASVADGVVYVGDEAGNVTAVDAKTGQYLVTAAAGFEVFGTPVVTNGMLFAGSLDGHIYAYAPGGAGADAIRRDDSAPRLSSLHPDMRLVPTR